MTHIGLEHSDYIVYVDESGDSLCSWALKNYFDYYRSITSMLVSPMLSSRHVVDVKTLLEFGSGF